jgi:4-amino-4-deoxy-L-arabinose transferase-like glycosyltransferase
MFLRVMIRNDQTHSSCTSPRTQTLRLGVGAAIFLAGTALRLRFLLADRSLWLDEAMLALNILRRNAIQLLQPLELEQVAPPVFLLLERFAVTLFGAGELALRLVPFLAGGLLLVVIWRVGAELLRPGWALLALGLAAASPLLVSYSGEVKQYSSDALVSAVLLALALEVFRRPEEPRRYWLLAGAGVLAIWSSLPSVFVLGGIGLAMLIEVRRTGLIRVAATGISWGLALAAVYLATYRASSRDPYLARFWADVYLDPRAPDFFQRLSTAASGIIEGSFFGASTPLPAPVLILALLITLLGLVALAKHHGRSVGALLIAPLALLGVAAVTHFYPPAPRLLLGLVPILVLGFTAGLQWLADRAPEGRARRVAAGSLALLAIAPASVGSARAALAPSDPAPAEAAVRELDAARRPGDAVYVFSRVVPVWVYYTTDWDAPDRARVEWLLEAARRIGPNSGNRPTRRTAVTAEGDELRREEGTYGTELVGIATGIEHPTPPDGRSTPDPGWAENETRRITRECGSGVWLFFSHGSDAAEAELLAALEAAGLARDIESRRRAVRIYRMTCPAGSSTR